MIATKIKIFDIRNSSYTCICNTPLRSCPDHDEDGDEDLSRTRPPPQYRDFSDPMNCVR